MCLIFEIKHFIISRKHQNAMKQAPKNWKEKEALIKRQFKEGDSIGWKHF